MTCRSLRRRCAELGLALLLVLAAPWALADTPISLFQSFAGNVNFTGTEATWRTSGTNVCTVITKKNQTVSKTLSGIPAGATILAAHLYWAGSGSAADYSVTFNNGSGSKTVNAQRQYSGTYVQGTTTYSYFGGAADVTSLVKGNGTYAFGGLTVDASATYCNVQGVLGGFALLVVYNDPAQPFRVLNMYEGFQYTRNSSITLNLSNFRMPSPLNGNTGRIGHITWEGDQSLNQQGENLSFNGTVLTDALNPSGNQFDSQSNIDGDTASYGIDFDAYTIGDPIIKAGDTSSTTTYASGQDLVWLNVELVAVPNVPTVDLQVTMTRTGEPVAGGAVSYAIVPFNNGPSTETGPVTVINTLPPGMSYSSVPGGTGWTCNINGQTATCQYTGNVVKNQVLPTITVNANVGTSGQYTTYTNTATIAGQMFDNVAANNTASDTSTDATLTAGNFAFTVGACAPDIAIGANGSGCIRYIGPYTAGTGQQLYITNLKNGIPTQVKNGDTTLKMQFSLTCINPNKNANVAANFAGATLNLCYAYDTTQPPATQFVPSIQPLPAGGNSNWTPTVDIFYPGKQPSGRLSATSVPVFTYFDVGLVQLNLYETSSKTTASTRFVAAPQTVKFTTIQNTGSGLNPAGASAFAQAGEQVKAFAQVLTAGTPARVAPNFGHETSPYGIAVSQVGGTTPVTFSPGGQNAGVFEVDLTYNDLGSIQLAANIAGLNGQETATLGSYLGVTMTPTDGSRTLPSPTTVGYFYPAYFQTQIGNPPMTCMAPMACPDGSATTTNGEPLQVAGAAYSAQPFSVDVSAFTAGGTDVTTSLSKITQFPIGITAWSKPGTTGVSLAAPAAFAAISGASVASDAAGPSSSTTISLKKPFDRTAPRDTSWQLPLTAYFRASASFTRPEKSDLITSNRGPGVKSKEGGLQFVQGRLLVASAFGSELLKLPLHVYAQYWTGTSWVNNPNDSDSPITYYNTYTSVSAFSKCAKNLVSAAPDFCKSAVAFLGVTPTVPGSISLDSGQGTIWMQAPGAGNNGKADVVIMPSAPWLPSTIGQAVFGVYKSPLIYIREVY